MFDLRGGCTRRDALRTVGGAIVGGTLFHGTTADIATGQSGSGESWPQYGYDAANTGYAPENTPVFDSVSIKWEYGGGSSPPAVVDGSVYVGGGKDVHAINIDDGAEEWGVEFENPTMYPPPAVADGVVFVGQRESGVFALNANDGTERWRFETENDDPSRVHFKVWKDTIYIAGGRRLCALDVNNGTKQWCLEIDGDIGSKPAVSDGTVYISYGESGSNDDFYALNAADGSQEWRFQTGLAFSSTPAVADETVYFGSSDTLFALDASDRTEQWRFETDSSLYVSPAVANGTVYIGSDDGFLYAVDTENGTEQWRFETGGRLSSPAVVGDTVYVGSEDTYLYTLDATDGSERWRFRAGGRVASPAIVDGTVYVGSDNALYALTGNTPEEVSTQTQSSNTRTATESPTSASVTTNGGSAGGGGSGDSGESNANGLVNDPGFVLPFAGALAAGAGGGLWYWRRRDDDEERSHSTVRDDERSTNSYNNPDTLSSVGVDTQFDRAPSEIPRAPGIAITYENLVEQETIGTGEDAVVVRATYPTPDGDVTLAVKKLRMNGTIGRERVREIIDSAETWDKLDDHDHIVGVVDYDAEPVPWIAMEYMDAGDLSDRAGNLDFEQACWIAVAIADGVHHAHRRGVAHLGLTPSNVLFRSVENAWDVPKVGDWGIAKHLFDHSKSIETISPQHAAPEQFDEEYGAADDLTDVYQLGSVFYELFTGEPPFTGSPAKVMNSVLHEEPTPPSEVADVPGELDGVLLTALSKNKGERYESVLLLQRAIRSLYDD
jgi:outer membrane protein assembly factor BamB